MTCRRCGQFTPRLTADQRYCPPCKAETDALLRADAARRTRFAFAKAVTP